MTHKRLLLRPSEAAEMLGLSKSLLYRMALDGEIPSCRIGYSVRFPLDALIRWVESRAEGGVPRIAGRGG